MKPSLLFLTLIVIYSKLPFAKSFIMFFFQIYANSSCTYDNIHYTYFFYQYILHPHSYV